MRLRILLAAGLMLAACARPAGQGRAVEVPPARPALPAPAASGGEFNDGDVMFLQMMVPHHEQGLTIVRLASGRSSRPEIRTLAAAIESTQADEVATMSEWLREWRQPLTAPAGSHAGHGGMPDTTAGEIAALGRISSQDFDRRFLNVLIAHQDDAIQLARMETATGTNQQARTLAERIAASRSAQIQQMLTMLDQT